MNRLSTAIASAALLAASAGAAHAQFVVERQVQAARQPDADASKSGSTVQTIITIKDDQHVEIRIENGQVAHARVNGSDWPADRIEHTGARLVLRNADGSEAHAFDLTPPAVPAAPPAPARVRVIAAPEAPRDVHATTARVGSVPPVPAAPLPPEPPPVMLGINLSDPGEALRAQLGLGDKPAILVESAIKGLPAIMSGMRRYDVIVSIDGSDGASRETLQQVLRRSSPGDEVDFTVIRNGAKQTITVRLEAYDASKLGLDAPTPPPQTARGLGMTPPTDGQPLELEIELGSERDASRHPEGQTDHEHLQALAAERAERLARIMSEHARGLSDAARPDSLEWEQLQRETLEKVESAMRNAERQVLELRNGRLFVRPAEEAHRSLEELSRSLRESRPEIDQAIEERVRSMEDRLGRLEERLEGGMDRLERLLERLSDRLERESQDQNG